MGKNLKKVIFSVLLLAAVIIVSPKDAKAAGKVWMAGFNDNSITIQWTPQSLNGYRVDGYYLEEIGTQRSIWQGSADTTQVTVQATKGYSGYIRLGYRLTSLATGKTYNWSVDSVYVNTTPADVAKNNFGITAAYANIKIDSEITKKNTEYLFLENDFHQNKKMLKPEEAATKDRIQIDYDDAKDEIAAEFIFLYPPGIPLVVPGEVIDKYVIDKIRQYEQYNMKVIGLNDHKIYIIR